MAKFDISKGIKKAQESVESLKAAAKDVKLPEIKVPHIKRGSENSSRETPEEKQPVPHTNGRQKILSTESALKIIYYLIAADGEITPSEETRFYEICKELDPDFDEKKERILAECKDELSKVIDDADYYDVLQEAAEKALSESQATEDSYITPKLLLWNLLSIAYSDGKYNEPERRLLKYLVRKTDVDKAVFLELESSMLTVMDIEKEINWIKTTNRPYLTIESIVNELNDRKNVIFASVKDLIVL